MSTGQSLEDELRDVIRKKQIVVVAGAGVSSNVTGNKAPGWQRLIESAVERCTELFPGEENWANPVRLLLEQSTQFPDMLLNAAEMVHQRLRQAGEGDFRGWLRMQFESLKPVDPAAIKAIKALNAPIVTTNYDGLLERVTRLKYVTWQDSAEVARVVRGDDRRILHLHGHWEKPETVILGIRSYESVRNHPHTQAVMMAFGIGKSFLFVGSSDDGLKDPNVGNFLKWLHHTESEAGGEHRHYRLVRHGDNVKVDGRVFPIVYGNDHSDLAGFLTRLAPAKPRASGGIKRKASNRSTCAVPATISAYLMQLEAETSTLKLMGFGRRLQIELPICDAYVPLQANLAMSLELKSSGRFPDQLDRTEATVEVSDMFRQAQELGHTGVVLLGEPGAGKTTAARQIAWRLASRQCLPEDLGLPEGTIPVLLRFRHLDTSTDGDNDLRTFLNSQTECKSEADGLTSPGSDLWNGKGGPLLWILDGLDEVIDHKARKHVSQWLQEAIRGRTKDRFLVTCRFAGYFREGVPLGPTFAEFHVKPLNDLQVARFVRDWYRTVYARIRLAQSLAESYSDELLRCLDEPGFRIGRMRDLRTNPMLLTILCLVFHDTKELPRNRAKLYDDCIEVLLKHWRMDLYQSEQGRSITPFDAEAARSVLAPIAWWMHLEQDRTAATLSDLKEQALPALLATKPDSGLGYDADAFLDRMKDEAGILATENDGRYSFLHLSFQEFLAAEYAATNLQAAYVVPRMVSSWWREVGLLSLRKSKPYCDAFFREMLNAGIVENQPELADQCLSEAGWFNADPFVEVVKKGKPVKRVAAVLRLIRDRLAQIPNLESLVKPLASSKDKGIRSAATEILTRLGSQQAGDVAQSMLVFDKKSQIVFIEIPAGKFQMGSADSPYIDEKPVQSVRISRAFQIGKYPVTNAQYSEFLQAAGGTVEVPSRWQDRRFNQPEQPVVGVSWDDAQRFCEWAECRLPTEAEWEYACRAGTTTAYSFGDGPEKLDEYGWYVTNSNGQSQPVGTKLPNSWGLHDMHGNVWEWCQDWYGDYGKSLVVDPAGPAKGTGRVLRGGSWNYPAVLCRSSIRDHYPPGSRYFCIGFRVARTL